MSKKIPHRSLSSNEESTQSSFLHVPSDLFNDFSLSLEEERILAIIRSYGGSCYWSVDRFAKYCRCSVRQTLRAIQKLEKSGRIQKKNRGSLSNLYSEIPLTCQPVMMTNCHDDKLSQSTCQTVTINMTACHNQHDSLSHYIDKDNTTYKDNYNTSMVADAPLPTEPLLKDSLIDLEPVKEPLEIQEAPPIPAAPPKAQKVVTWDDVRGMVTDEEWAAIETWIDYRANVHKKKKPTTPLAVKKSITKHGKFVCRAIQYSMEKKWEGIELPDSIKNASISKTGLTKEQIDTLWDLGWKHYHPKDWPEQKAPPHWVDEWHRELYRRACCEAFGANYQSFIEGEPAQKSNFNIGKFRRAIETIDLPETAE